MSNDWPHVGRHILATVGPKEANASWLLPRYLRRGRLCEVVATMALRGQEIESEWWGQSSGAGDSDLVVHEELRPYYEQALKLKREHKIRLIGAQARVEHSLLRYVGTIDWLLEHNDRLSIWDVKCGQPPTPDSAYDYYCRIQLALYQLAYFFQHKALPQTANLHLWPGGYRIVHRFNPADREAATTLAYYYHERQRWFGRCPTSA